MSKLSAVTLILLSMILLSILGGYLPASAQNPFLSKEKQSKVSQAPGLPIPFLTRITCWQQQLNQKMSFMVRQAKETGSLKPLFILFFIAFIYGVLHAAGPGHGKAVTLSYLVSRKIKVAGGIFLGNMIALFHGLSGVGMVLTVHFIIHKGISGHLESVTRTTQLISYSLIALLGTIMLIKNIMSWTRRNGAEKSKQGVYLPARHAHLIGIALCVGMVPCPGVLLIMLFCLSLNMIWLGLALVFFFTLGMAVTISAVGVIGLAGKKITFGAIERRKRWVQFIERSIETLAAFMLMTLGGFFLAASI